MSNDKCNCPVCEMDELIERVLESEPPAEIKIGALALALGRLLKGYGEQDRSALTMATLAIVALEAGAPIGVATLPNVGDQPAGTVH